MNDAHVPARRAHSPTAIPRWLIYGLAAKLALLVGIVIAVLWYAGILG